ncbi:hypothetical protein RclHR1_03220021 [Rhizophagus clarus]|uniref:Ricin B lectin domain-containing protein n=1 Tax=Rhizophagus clarus TaxID=94130 RepID=A0A2Z6S324_9GLOM|nr:hypothetical protein RclHR1_03220021 [Rhizophagus clarus]GES95406.1 hypothetical protein RCL_jg9704.t1 [Rhizophagus clarus]
MKFNLFLLILTSLIAVALGRPDVVTSKIRSDAIGLYWTTPDGVEIDLDSQGIKWRLVYLNENTALISPFEISPTGSFVQYNGPGERLNITKVATNSEDFPPELQWEIKLSPIQITPPRFYICSKSDLSQSATAVETGEKKGIVIADNKDPHGQLWILEAF